MQKKKGTGASTAVDFFYEAGALKNLPRSGWRLAGIRNAESTADHSHRAAIIAYVIARMEGADAERAATLAVFHDLPEARIGELDKVMASYHDKPAAERKAVRESEANGLFGGKWYSEIIAEVEAKKTPESKAANDADLLELVLTAIEYAQSGFPKARDWTLAKQKLMLTKSGRKLYDSALASDSSSWWKKVWQRQGLLRKT
ncbi:MAG: HD domain-containing protein [Candidatus Micrarchaeia archaeon]|jgi:putative hydrolase of HD superfamily